MKRRIFLSQSLLLALSACSLGRSVPELAHYDLGIDPPAGIESRVSRSIALDEVVAVAWLQTHAMPYRLAYRDPAQLHTYSRSRWTAAPAALLTQRLRLALSGSAERGFTMASDGVPSEYLLKIDLDAFEQMIQSPTSASGLVRMRASLIEGSARSLRAQRSFSVEQPCPSVDAEGAVRGLRSASDSVIAQMLEWLAAVIAAER